jgi:hypothetical protein
MKRGYNNYYNKFSKSHSSKPNHISKSSHGHSKTKDCDKSKSKPNPAYLMKRGYNNYKFSKSHSSKPNHISKSKHISKSSHGHSKTKDCDKNKSKPNPAYLMKRGYDDYTPAGKDGLHYRKPVIPRYGGKDNYRNKFSKSHSSKSNRISKSSHIHSKTKDCDKSKSESNPAYLMKRGYDNYAPQSYYGTAPAGNKRYRNPVSINKNKKHSHYSKSSKSHSSKRRDIKSHGSRASHNNSKTKDCDKKSYKPVIKSYVSSRP